MNKRISDIFSYGDDPIFWEHCDEIDPETVKALTMRRIHPRRAQRVSRTLLIAAVLVSLLTVSAIAVGLSVQTQRKENLRQMLEIDAKNVDGYTEFPLPAESDSTEAAPSVVLLSAVKDGEFEDVYISISPIEEEDLFTEDRFCWTVDGQSFGHLIPVYDHKKLDFTEPVTDKDTGVTFYQPTQEQQQQLILENYDPETKSGLFTFGMVCSVDDVDQPLDISICKFYRNRDTLEVTEWEELGTIHLDPIDKSCLRVCFSSKPTFENPDTGGKGSILGVDIYATGMNWTVQHDDMADIYTASDGTPPQLEGDELRALQSTWLRTLDSVFLSGMTIECTDGEKIEVSSSVLSSNYDGNQVVCYVPTPETLDLSRIASITILGETASIIK